MIFKYLNNNILNLKIFLRQKNHLLIISRFFLFDIIYILKERIFNSSLFLLKEVNLTLFKNFFNNPGFFIPGFFLTKLKEA